MAFSGAVSVQRQIDPAILSAIADSFPIRGELASLELANAETPLVIADGAQRIVVRLVVWEKNADESLSIRDVKEQEVWFPPVTDAARLRLCFEGFSRAFRAIVDTNPEVVSVLMPHDLMRFDPLGMTTLETAEDFERAFLVKSRLGRYLTMKL